MEAKIGRNDPCPCDSGKKYKHCHLDKEPDVSFSDARIAHEIQKAWQHSKCFFPLASKQNCSKKIIDAHTLQRSASLAKLIDSNNHVKTFYKINPLRDASEYPIDIGWHKASTFTGFCKTHDSAIFAPLEEGQYVGTLEQDFLLGYRALCHEIFQKEGALRAAPVIERMLIKKLPTLREEIKRDTAISVAGTKKGIKSFQRIKEIMDDQVISKNYSGWSRASISFSGDLCIASTGAITPNRTISGDVLQILHDPTSENQHLLLSLVAAAGGGVLTMLWRTEDIAPASFVQSLISVREKLPSFIVQSVFAYLENTFFSKNWWDSLSEYDKAHIHSLANIGNVYYTDFNYSDSLLVPWEITNISS